MNGFRTVCQDGNDKPAKVVEDEEVAAGNEQFVEELETGVLFITITIMIGGLTVNNTTISANNALCWMICSNCQGKKPVIRRGAGGGRWRRWRWPPCRWGRPSLPGQRRSRSISGIPQLLLLLIVEDKHTFDDKGALLPEGYLWEHARHHVVMVLSS